MKSQNDYELEQEFSVTTVNKEIGSFSQCLNCKTRCTWRGADREGCEDYGRDD